MVRSLVSISAEKVRKCWSRYDSDYRKIAFDLVWRDFVGTGSFPSELEAFCRNDSVFHLDLTNLSAKDRRRWHDMAERLGLDHVSTGPTSKRVLTLCKAREWNWEFTTRKPQPPPPRRQRPCRRSYQEREEYLEAHFQVLCKFSAHGYHSPYEMLENEPELLDILGSDV